MLAWHTGCCALLCLTVTWQSQAQQLGNQGAGQQGNWSLSEHAGYGVQNPETMIDVWVTMFSLLTGTTMWLILGSIITTLLIHLNAAHSEYTAKMTALSQYMVENNLPQVSFLKRCMHATSC